MASEENPNPSMRELVRYRKSFSDLIDTLANVVGTWKENTLKNKELLQVNYEHVGKIITCHLVIENLLNKTIVMNYKFREDTFHDMRLSFAQKIKMLPKSNLYDFVIPGIREVNTIRNKIAHNLNYDVGLAPARFMNGVLHNIIKDDLKTMSLERKIEEFTNVCISAFSYSSEEIDKHWNSFQKKHPGLYGNIADFFAISKDDQDH